MGHPQIKRWATHSSAPPPSHKPVQSASPHSIGAGCEWPCSAPVPLQATCCVPTQQPSCALCCACQGPTAPTCQPTPHAARGLLPQSRPSSPAPDSSVAPPLCTHWHQAPWQQVAHGSRHAWQCQQEPRSSSARLPAWLPNTRCALILQVEYQLQLVANLPASATAQCVQPVLLHSCCGCRMLHAALIITCRPEPIQHATTGQPAATQPHSHCPKPLPGSQNSQPHVAGTNSLPTTHSSKDKQRAPGSSTGRPRKAQSACCATSMQLWHLA